MKSLHEAAEEAFRQMYIMFADFKVRTLIVNGCSFGLSARLTLHFKSARLRNPRE